ncbi:MAG: hypothetical protein HY348_03065, partial [Nitrospira defluvii]|nr:hypothetical protein [Nitrospira defluvii]
MRTPIKCLVLAAVCLSAVDPVLAESISVQDRDEIARLRSARGFATEEVSSLLEQVNKAGERGIPTEPLANKVKEGLAKGVDPKRIDPVLRQMVTHFESAQEVLREAGTRGVVEGNRRAAVETLAEAFSRGATAEEVRELTRLSQDGKQKVTQESLAAGAKSLAVMKEGKIASKEGAALVGEGMRQGYKPSELLDLSREVKRRGGEFREGRVNMQSLREQVRRGERGDRLFRDEHGDSGGGDRGDRGGNA